MTFQPRDEFLTERLSGLLSRLSPPRAILTNPEAQRAEVAMLLRGVLRLAPSRDYADWWGRFEDELLRRMKTRAWPISSEMDQAARGLSAGRGETDDNDNRIEAGAISRLEDWFGKFKSQMPGHGRPERTSELIRRGVLPNERAARFHGFDLSQHARETALEQPMGDDEWRHHIAVIARLRGIAPNEAEFTERAALSANQLPRRAPVFPDKRMPVGDYARQG